MEIILDITSSMLKKDDVNDPLKDTIEATNSLIDQVKKYSSNSKIGITVYWGTAKEMVPLSEKTPWIDLNYTTVKDENKMDEPVLSYQTEKGNDGTKQTFNPINENLGGGTNTQSGIITGMKILAENKESKEIELPSGEVINRIPTVVLMTDGQSNHSLANLEDSDVKNGQINYETPASEVTVSGKWWNTTDVSVASSSEVATMKAVLSAAYYKTAIAHNYNIGNINNVLIYTVGLNTGDNINVKALLDPEQNFNESSKEPYLGLYNQYNNWKNGTSTQITIESEKKDGYKKQPFSLSRPATTYVFDRLGENEYGITMDNININYATKSYDTKNDQIIEVFDDIYNQIILDMKKFIPIGNEKNENDEKNVLSYVDPIGKYMEVKDVSKLLLFGKQYDIVKYGEPVIESIKEKSITKQNYKAVDSNGEDLQISNLSYDENATFKLSDIEIWSEIIKNNSDESGYVDSQESIYINIPKVALPVKVDSIEINSKGEVTDYKSNVDTEDALPIRVVYTVGISNEILEKNEINMTKVLKEYISDNRQKENGKEKTYFYTNDYTKQIYNGNNTVTNGNAYIEFLPSTENRFYTFQKNTVIYKKSSGGDSNGEGIVSQDGVSLSEEVKSIDEINKNDTYYFIIDYYVPYEEQNEIKGGLVQYAVSQKGEDFYGLDGECYLTYYDSETKKETQEKNEHTVVATKIGGKRVGNLNKLSKNKNENTTNTATNYYAPVYKDTEKNNAIITYLGNNGRLSIETSLGNAKIIKTREDDTPLEGATFALYAQEDIYLNKELIYKKGEEIERKTTGKDGVIEFQDLYIGKYEIKEIEAPEGYKLLEDIIEFEVTEENLEHEFKIKNNVLYGLAKVIKTGEDDTPLEGATFALYAQEDIYLNKELIYKKGEEIERKTTGKDGVIEFQDLYIGKYEIKEVEAPKGYKLLEDTISFELTKENLEYKITIENTKIQEEKPQKEDKNLPPEKENKNLTSKLPNEKAQDNTVVSNQLPKTGEKTKLILLTLLLDVSSISIFLLVKWIKLRDI